MAPRISSLFVLVLSSVACGTAPEHHAVADATVVASAVASVRASTATTSGTVDLVRNPDDTYALVLSTPRASGHVVADAYWVFAGAAAPGTGTHAVEDAAPGSWLRCSGTGGDVDAWPGRHGARATLTLTEATGGAIHGTLEVNLAFSGFTAAF